jgi:hypothetical protein
VSWFHCDDRQAVTPDNPITSREVIRSHLNRRKASKGRNIRRIGPHKMELGHVKFDYAHFTHSQLRKREVVHAGVRLSYGQGNQKKRHSERAPHVEEAGFGRISSM